MIDRKDLHIRDPFVLPYDGGYVVCGTSKANGFDAYRSMDLETFEGPYELFNDTACVYEPNNYWAPEIHPYKGKYYMFATMLPRGGNRLCQILVADSPLEKFLPLARITPEAWVCLDASFYVEDGTPYAVFCHEWTQIVDGEICAVELKADLSGTVGEPITLFKATEAPWARSIRFVEKNKTYDGYVTDGPFLFLEEGKLKMLWSSFGENNTYSQSIVVSRSGKIAGPWMQEETPRYADNGGHGMVFKKENDWILSLHAPNDPAGEERLQLITRRSAAQCG